ncbi:MAG TPA: hypothetical protein VF258_11545, partial [Luteolibacter sp.]
LLPRLQQPLEILNTLRATLFHDDSAGERCLLDHPMVREAVFTFERPGEGRRTKASTSPPFGLSFRRRDPGTLAPRRLIFPEN